jgi:hypothetical protein
MRPEDKAQLQREHALLTAYLTEWAPTVKEAQLWTLRAVHSDLEALKFKLLDAFDDADRDLNSVTIAVVAVNRMLNMLEEEIALREE